MAGSTHVQADESANGYDHQRQPEDIHQPGQLVVFVGYPRGDEQTPNEPADSYP